MNIKSKIQYRDVLN